MVDETSCVVSHFQSQSKGFPNLGSSEAAVDDLVKKSQKIGEIDPESTVQTAGIEATIHYRVVPLDHHEPFALQTIHDPNVLVQTIHLIRFMTNAKQPARRPPPKIVVPKER